MALNSNEHALIAVHEARISALVQGDLDALDQIVADELVFVSAVGKVLRKPEIVEAIANGQMEIRRIESSDIEVRSYGDVALLRYRALTTVRDGAQTIDGETQNTCVFVHRDGRWQMVNQHQCPIAG